MKKNKIILMVFFLASLTYSCKKESKDISSVTTYPEIELTGDRFMTIAAGSTYSEPGATATIGGSAVALTTEGAVDANTPGVYILTYSAKNAEGYAASKQRWVGVIKADATGDYSGVYERTNGVVVNVTKIKNGLFVTDNVGGVDPIGSPSFTYDVRIFNTKDSTFVIPPQPSAVGGEVYCSGVIHSPSTGLGQYKYVVIGPGYGTSVRTFNKQ